MASNPILERWNLPWASYLGVCFNHNLFTSCVSLDGVSTLSGRGEVCGLSFVKKSQLQFYHYPKFFKVELYSPSNFLLLFKIPRREFLSFLLSSLHSQLLAVYSFLPAQSTNQTIPTQNQFTCKQIYKIEEIFSASYSP